MALRIVMYPSPSSFREHESGIRRVVEAYDKYLPNFDIEIVTENEPHDIVAVHAGSGKPSSVAHCHGLYWTGDMDVDAWEWKANKYVIDSLRHARVTTVPSEWVAESLRRDMRVNPHVVPHGIDAEAWDHDEENMGYVLWNKNRGGVDVCNPYPVTDLALRFPRIRFLTTFSTDDPSDNIKVTGVVPHDEMALSIQRAAVYLATTKETFGIGTLEAMASGVPILGFAHGGILDMVQHGVNGYLAEPNNYEDLAEGLNYCMKYGPYLGGNGRQLAKNFTWMEACEKVAGVYRLAAQGEQPTVSIVIPTYNYGSKVGRAITSAMSQTYDQLEAIIVVDDGSTDHTEEAVGEYIEQDPRIRYIKQENAGVANARNTGISMSASKYIACLDADDALDPHFIEACVPALEEDRSLGIAYTGLQWIKPDGTTGVSAWPGEFVFDKQLKRQNQVPTACLFRREMWERLGGYKQRYAPDGAGAEDAEFWLRAGAYGWGAEKATGQPLFIYSWMSGRVSGSENYSETDWLAWHPWVVDHKPPFASVATPKGNRFSHPVRQYDEPLVSVVIPVGPKHWEQLETALDSLEAQTIRKWEAIVVNDTAGEPPERLKKAYPYILWHKTRDSKGAGAARNIGADNARAPFLLYLDADDFLYPKALEKMLAAWNKTGEAVYSDYIGRAFIKEGDLDKLSSDLAILHRGNDDDTAILHSAATYDCEKARAQPGKRPFIWNNITTLFPREWHHEIGGFDESMPSWEDVDYWWRMAWAGKCFHRIEEPLMVYRFYSGFRREEGLQRRHGLIEYLKVKKQGIKIMGCGCSGGAGAQVKQVAQLVKQTQQESRMLDDEDIVMVKYLSPNRGQHGVTGQATKKFYGYRKGGDEFLMDRRDIAVQPHMYSEIPNFNAVAARAARPSRSVDQEMPPELLEGVEVSLPEEEVFDQEEYMAGLTVAADLDTEIDMQTLPSITPAIASRMERSGIRTKRDIIQMGVEGLEGAVKGIGPGRAQMIMAYVTANS